MSYTVAHMRIFTTVCAILGSMTILYNFNASSYKLSALPTVSIIDINTFFNKISSRKIEDLSQSCPGVLKGLMYGTWRTRPLTKQEDSDITVFLKNRDTRYRLPEGFERPDKLCGNVTSIGSKNYRALCDPKGHNPCCYKNICAMKSVDECVCDECYDQRTRKHAEYSTWMPSDTRCIYKKYSQEDACASLKGMHLMFVGDSLIRHVYTALLMVLSGDLAYGALKRETPEGIKRQCRGMYMFTEKLCRLQLNMTAVVCSGNVKIGMKYFSSVVHGQAFKQLVKSMVDKSLVLTGIGAHCNMNATAVQKNYLMPVIQSKAQRNTTWPRLLWAHHHAPGLLKSPFYFEQTSNAVKQFNIEMEEFCKLWHLNTFDTFNMTSKMTSFDGEHYGLGINVVKVDMLLSYIQELRIEEHW